MSFVGTPKKVKHVIIHSGYDPSNDYRDMALAKLETPVPSWTDYIQPACVRWTGDDVPQINDKVYVIGWGLIENKGFESEQLRGVGITVHSNDFCGDVYDMSFDNSQICAGHKPGGLDSCQGDSGGPLLYKGVIQGEVVDYLVGAVSFGGACAAPDAAAIYSGRFEILAGFVPSVETNGFILH